MVNVSALGKSLLFFLLLVMLAQPGLLSASQHFSSLRSVGLLTDQTYNETISEKCSSDKSNSDSDSSFFGTLGPDTSKRGAVKTFKVTVVNRASTSEAWPKISKSKAGGSEKTELLSNFLARPVSSGRISSLFGSRRHPKTRAVRFHSGVDIAAPRGTPINSALSGKVAFSGWKRGYGLMLVIDHGNGLETVYAHCSKISVKPGQNVNTGQRVALVGNTGVATGPHLHFEVRRDGNVRNPLRYLNY